MFNSNPTAPLLLSIALSTSASAMLLPASVRLTDPSLAVANVSLNAGPPDPRFTISPKFDSPLLPIDPCLVNVLFFMSEIAYGDFTQRHPPRTYRAPGYDEVEISTGPVMSARFLLWGAWLAMEYMIGNSRFHNVDWTLRWEATVVGTLTIQASATPRLSLPGSINTPRPHTPITPNSTATPNPPIAPPNVPNPSPGAPQLAVTVESFADSKPLTKYEVFMAAYTGLLQCAQQPTADPMHSFALRSPVGAVSLHVFETGPGLAYGFVIRALSHIPRYLQRDPRGYREVSFDLRLDDVLCARGAFTKGRE